MKKRFINIITIAVFASLVFSCSEIFDKATVEKSREEATSKIIFDANGGAWESDGESVHTVLGVIGKPLLLANVVDKPERAGYVFKDWISNNDDAAYSDYKSIEKVPEKDLRYTAKWEIDFVEVTFKEKRISIAKGTTTPIPLKASWVPADATEDEIAGADINWTTEGDTSCFTLTKDASDPSKATVSLNNSASIGKSITVTIKLKKTATLNLEAKCQVIVAEDLEKLGEYKTLSSYSGSVSSGTYVTFGTFPQSVMDEKNVKILGEEFDEWYECYVKEEHGDQTYYLGSDGCWYVKAVSNPANGTTTFTDTAKTPIEKEDKNGDNKEYYFKVEPIVWRVVTSNYTDAENNTYKLLVSEKVLTANINFLANSNDRNLHGTTVSANDWEYSNVRAYLNGKENAYVTDGGSGAYADYSNKGFLQIAFTEDQQEEIKQIKVANDKSTTVDNNSSTIMTEIDDRIGKDTYDKIFVLSVNEVSMSGYGFNATAFTFNAGSEKPTPVSDNAKKRAVTDYALVNFAKSNGTWWLRSRTPIIYNSQKNDTPPVTPNYVTTSNQYGRMMFIVNDNVITYESVVYKNIGIVPALCVAP